MVFDSDLELFLEQGLKEIGLDVPQGAIQKLMSFVVLLDKWNQVFNLTAIKDPNQSVIRHIFDSLSALPFLFGHRIIDVGTGAGLPGIPLAAVLPEHEFVLLDSNGKKTRFVLQAVSELGLKNITVVQTRVEMYHPELLFDTVMSRAFASIRDMINKTKHLCAPQGIFLTMKGEYPETELETLPNGVIVSEIQKVDVPGLNAERHIVCLKRAS